MADQRARGGQKVGTDNPGESTRHEPVHPETDKTFAEQVQEEQADDRRDEDGAGQE
jgi:hypothetical protein